MSKNPAQKHQPARRQYGALPYRLHGSAAVEVLLVTSRVTKRWIIPKGWPIKGLKPGEAAAREAYEEAGVRGHVGRAIGNYTYDKYSETRQASTPCKVHVFPLAVTRQLKDWPEAKERKAQWYSVAEAASVVGEEGLRALILRLQSLKDKAPKT
ncbi:NUDIX domain-containing protein [Rhizobiales bacterium GAS188]|nr:NUDIX domain-containing protein [Rhizobiales bacterium GAS188]